MDAISRYMSADHRRCDDLFAAAEAAAGAGLWQDSQPAFEAFIEATERHLALEEDVLFPAFEARTGSAGGPTEVMRREHTQMRELIRELGETLVRRDPQGFTGIAEGLTILMQQHNLKEEAILYGMLDAALGAEQAELLARLESAAEGSGPRPG